jgi:hypothetical protein
MQRGKSRSPGRFFRGASGLLLLSLLGPAVAARSLPASEVVVAGRVLGPSGRLSQARIELIPFQNPYESGRSILEGGLRPEPEAGALSDAQGWFRVVAPEIGMWRLSAAAPGFVPMEYPLVPLTEEVDVPEVVLPRDRGLEVRVLSESGQPVAGASVLATPLRPRDAYQAWKPAWVPAPQLRRTDGQGLARLPFPRGDTYRVEVTAPGYQVVSVSGVRQTTLRVRLARGTERRVRVRDARRRFAAGVLAWVEELELPAAVSDEQGWITLSIPEGRRTAVRFLAAGGDHGSSLVAPLRGAVKADLVDLEPEEVVAGRVLALPGRMPVAGALVWLGERFGSFVRADSTGAFRLPVMAASRGNFRAAAPGYFEEKVSRPLRPPGPSIALRPKAVLTGTLVDGGGRPVTGAEIRARFEREPGRRAGPALWESGGSFRSAGAGRFRVDRLVPGVTYSLRFAKPGFAPRVIQAAAPQPGALREPLRVVLEPGRAAYGFVRDREERPVPGAVVALQPAPSGNMAARIRALRDPDPALSVQAVTDEQGRFEARDLRPGRFELAVQAAGFAEARIPGVRVPDGPGPLDLGTVVLEEEAFVVGRVEDSQGRPVEGAGVRAGPSDPVEDALGTGGGGSEPDAVSDASGRFQVFGQRAGGRLRLVAERTGYAPASAYVAVPTQEPAVLTLIPASRVEGRVTDADGDPISGVPLGGVAERIYVLGGMAATMGRTHSAVSREDGSFGFEAVEPGRLVITAYGRGWQESKLEIEVPEGEDLEGVELVLEPAAVVAGRVLAPDGSPVVGAEIGRHEPLRPGEVMRITAPLAVSDGDGGYQIGGLAPGPIHLAATHGVFGRAARDFEVLPGENRLDFELRGGRKISGNVVEPSGAPAAGARVWIRPAAGGPAPPAVASEADGSFLFDGLTPGDYRIEAMKDGTGRTREPLAVPIGDGSRDGLVLELQRTGSIRGRIDGLNVDELAQVRVSAGWGAGIGEVSHDGSYRISDLPPGTWRVVAELPRTGRRAEGEVALDPEIGDADLDLDFGSGLALSGTVRRNGRPYSGAALRLEGSGSPPAWSETDPQGRFRLEGLQPGSYSLEISDYRTGLVQARAVDLQRDEDLLIDLRTVSVEGVILDSETREPVPQAEVTLTSAGSGTAPVNRQTVAGADGSFTFREVGRGTWRLSAGKRGYGWTEQVITLDEQRVGWIEVSLERTPRQLSESDLGGR